MFCFMSLTICLCYNQILHDIFTCATWCSSLSISSYNSVGGPPHNPAVLDKEEKLLKKFFDKKLQIGNVTKQRRASQQGMILPTLVLDASTLTTTTTTTTQLETAKEVSAAEETGGEVAVENAGTAAAAAAEATEELKEEPGPAALLPVVEILRVSLLGIQTTDKPTAVSNATSPQARAAVPKIRSRGTTYNSFQNLQKDMEKVSIKNLVENFDNFRQFLTLLLPLLSSLFFSLLSSC